MLNKEEIELSYYDTHYWDGAIEQYRSKVTGIPMVFENLFHIKSNKWIIQRIDYTRSIVYSELTYEISVDQAVEWIDKNRDKVIY